MAEFGDMPELIADGTMELSRFLYDHERRMFINGSSEHPLLADSTYRGIHVMDDALVPILEIPQVPLLMNVFGNFVSTPKFFTWLTKMDIKAVFDETAGVIRDTHSELTGIKNKSKDRSLSAWNARLGFTNKGHVLLQTVGNTAQLGVSADSHDIGYKEWGTGYSTYELHNNDWRAQTVSLLAGLGHLAARCEAETKI